MPRPWSAPYAGGPVIGEVMLPGSKSMTNRALVLGALASEPTTITGTLIARDSELAVAGLRAMGARVDVDGTTVTIFPAPLRGPASVDCGLAGTVMRFLPVVAALADGSVTFDGDERARQRPLAPLTSALRGLGVAVDADSLPLTVAGTGSVVGGEATVDSSSSSQFVSALLLGAPRFERGLVLHHRGPAMPSLPHVDMTVDMLRRRGVRVIVEADDLTAITWRVAGGPIAGGQIEVEPDLSNAGPFLAAAMVTGGRVRVTGWPVATNQAGDALRGIFTAMGAHIEVSTGGLTLTGPAQLRGVDLDLSAVGELVPTIAAVAAFAESATSIRNIGHLRGHETDRLSALATELTRLGSLVVEEDDALIIIPGPMRGAVVDCYDDHRMATFAAIIGLRVPDVQLSDVTATGKTMPDFPELWIDLVGTH